jgi:hypothetical protein
VHCAQAAGLEAHDVREYFPLDSDPGQRQPHLGA